MHLRTSIIGLFLLLRIAVSAQYENTRWYFGGWAGLDFMNSPPTALFDNKQFTSEGCVSVSDGAGNLLFYTAFDTIWNRQHQIMQNGIGLSGGFSTTQSALAIKQPGNGSIYYLFTLAADLFPDGLCYSIIDMSLAAGDGSVTAMNIPIFTPSCEKLAAVRHCNGTDIWIVTHDWGSNNVRANLLTAAGVNTVSVISTGGLSYSLTSEYAGEWKFSPNGIKLAAAIHYIDSSSMTTGGFEIFDFDRATGMVSNPILLAKGPAYTGAYGIEFSPDGTKLYGTTNYFGINELHQWDLCAGTTSSIISSFTTIPSDGTYIFGLQLGPDNKIYVSRTYDEYIGVINSPDLLGGQCNYVDQAISLSPQYCIAGLPNILKTRAQKIVPPFTFTQVCRNVSFSRDTIASCRYAAGPVLAQVWNFGDPASGAANTSTLAAPAHLYSGPGIFTAQAIFYRACDSDTLQKIISITTATQTSASADTVCAGQTLNLYSGTLTGVSYSWTGPGSFTSAAANPTLTNVNVTMNGVYNLTVETTNGCLASTSATALVSPGFTASASSNTPCLLQTLNLNAPAAGFYQWSGPNNYTSSSQNPVINSIGLSSLGIYTLVSGTGLCSDTTTLQVSGYPLPVLITAESGTVCENELLQLIVSNAGITYNWTGPNNYVSSLQNPTLAAQPAGSGLYMVTVTDSNNCQASASTSVIVIEAPKAVAFPANSCTGQVVNLSASGGSIYTWAGPNGFTASGQSVDFIAANPQMSGIYTLTTFGNANCSATGTVLVTVFAPASATINVPLQLCVPFCEHFGLLTKASPFYFTDVSFQINNQRFNGANPYYCFKTPGDYYIKAMFKDSNNCANSSVLSLKAYDRPKANFEFMPLHPKVGIEPVAFSNTSLGEDQTSWTWYFIDNGRDSQEGQRTSFLFETAGNFPIALVVKNKWGCADTAVKNLIIDDEFNIYVPNAFTPDGDGINDAFFAKGSGIKSYFLRIYDRWGTCIFETEDFYKSWEGNFKGELCKQDVYVWKMTVTGSDGKLRELNGHVTLYR